MAKHSWSPSHAHAGDKQWTERDPFSSRSHVWSWAKCGTCGRKTAIVVGAKGTPACDECFEKVSLSWS